MEQLVRPFLSADPASTARIVVTKIQVSITPAHLCWGTAGKLPTAVEQDTTFNGTNFRVEECDESLAEDTRVTEDIKVDNPSNPNQYVIVQRIVKIKFKKTSKQKFLGVFHTDTTDFGMPDLFAGSAFGDVPQQSKCSQTMLINRK